MELTGQEKRLLHEALCDAFRSVQALREMVLFRCNKNLYLFTDGSLNDRVFQLIDEADAHGWIDGLVEGARAANSGNHLLAAFYLRFNGAVHRTATVGSLERVVKQSRRFHDVVVFREAIERAERQVCRVLTNGRFSGTGFLVAADVVLTNEHVVQDCQASDIELEFDYKVPAPGGRASPGKVYGVASVLETQPSSAADASPPPKPFEATTSELDYAFVHVAGTPGNESAGGVERGWVEVAEPGHIIPVGSDLIIVQHPGGAPLKMTMDEVQDINRGRTRVTYTTNTQPGSSGSPCFDADWRVVALHHSGDPRDNDPAKYNEGIPMATVRANVGPGVKRMLGWK